MRYLLSTGFSQKKFQFSEALISNLSEVSQTSFSAISWVIIPSRVWRACPWTSATGPGWNNLQCSFMDSLYRHNPQFLSTSVESVAKYSPVSRFGPDLLFHLLSLASLASLHCWSCGNITSATREEVSALLALTWTLCFQLHNPPETARNPNIDQS